MTHETQRRKHWHLGSITALVATLAVVAGSLAATVAPASAAGWYRHHGTTTTTSSTTTSTSPTTTTSTTATPSGEPGVRGFAGPPGVRFCLVRQHRRRGHGWVWVTTRARCVVKAHGQGAGNGRGGHNYSTTTTSSTTTSSTTTSSTTSTTLAAANCTAAESGTPLSRAGLGGEHQRSLFGRRPARQRSGRQPGHTVQHRRARGLGPVLRGGPGLGPDLRRAGNGRAQLDDRLRPGL